MKPALSYRSILALCLLTLSGGWQCLLSGSVETGTHWPSTDDYPELRQLGYQFVVTTVGPNRAEWEQTFDAAAEAGLQLIVGCYPPPYIPRGDDWTITADGVAFLKFAESRASLVKAVFVFNEPYWVHPISGGNRLCGALTARQLRNLRTRIRSVWPEAKIYHDIGQPSEWAPGGEHRKEYNCVGDKYADATGVADYVGVWAYPFEAGKYDRARGLAILGREIAYVRTTMQAEPVVTGQAFRCDACDPMIRWPAGKELRDWNCAVRSLQPHGISWYVWRQDLYDDMLANHPESWQQTTAGACELSWRIDPFGIDFERNFPVRESPE